MEDAGDIRRRDNYCIGSSFGVWLGVKKFFIFPKFIPFRFRIFWIIDGWNFSHILIYDLRSLSNLYSTESTSASQDASIMFSDTPIVHHESLASCD